MFTRSEEVNLDFSKATTYIFLFTEKPFMHSIRSTNDHEIGWPISFYVDCCKAAEPNSIQE
jgi:hypothetical protein